MTRAARGATARAALGGGCAGDGTGDTIQKGQPIALIGSTGRSTGPHLHFEVLKQGRAVDPMSFVKR